MTKHFSFLSLFVLLMAISFFSCKKDPLTDPNFELTFSTDTLSFDTVFVTLGSTTEFFAIKNDANQPVTISEIRLEDGDASAFRINIDGVSLPNGVQNDVTIPSKDSIYIFVEVTVDPNAAVLPFLIEDRILFNTNGREQDVILQAYGQNAHFFRDSILTSQTWEDDLPYVVLSSILVDECEKLTIEEGVDIYFNGGASLFVAGEIEVKGTKDSLVTFRGIRLDDVTSDVSYDEIPGQWNGIYLLRNNMCNESSFEYTEIRNAQFGLIIGTTTSEEFPNATIDNGPVVAIKNSYIYNNSVFGILAINSTINAENLLMYKAGSYLTAFQLGGNYNFEHCTFNSRGSQFLDHQDQLLFFSNAIQVGGGNIYISDLEALNFTNCIMYGSLDEEIEIDTLSGTGAELNYKFDHCLLKTELELGDNAIDCIFNQAPDFFMPEDPEDAIDDDYRLASSSPAVNKGNTATAGSLDLNGNVRDAQPDIGAYELEQ